VWLFPIAADVMMGAEVEEAKGPSEPSRIGVGYETFAGRWEPSWPFSLRPQPYRVPIVSNANECTALHPEKTRSTLTEGRRTVGTIKWYGAMSPLLLLSFSLPTTDESNVPV
jgi:hypothetical protein